MQLYSQVSGNGRDLVLLTGLAASTRYWNHLHEQLISAGFRVIRLDLLGFGRSPRLRSKGDGAYTMDTHMASIVDTLKQLEVHEAVIVGHSMSCSLALRIAATHPELCSHALLFCPPLYASLESADNFAYSSGNMPRWILDGIYARMICRLICSNKALAIPIYRRVATTVPMEVREDARLHDWKSYRESFDNVILHYRAEADLARSKTPTTLVYGLADKSVDVPYLEALAQNHSHVRTIPVANGTHQIPNQFPELVIKIITAA
jgi:pimeloyl-ACP methyl ester carboxylesterase